MNEEEKEDSKKDDSHCGPNQNMQASGVTWRKMWIQQEASRSSSPVLIAFSLFIAW